MFLSRVSVIDGHNRDTNSDSLYKPLRDTLLEDTTAKKTYLSDVSRFSHVSHSAQTHTFIENRKIAEQTMILEDVHLHPSSDLFRVAGRRYQIINAQQTKLNPITEEELADRLKNAEQEKVIVYVYDQQNQEKNSGGQQVLPIAQQQKQLKRPKSGIKLTLPPRYNFFSILDPSINSGSCMCPANELIASEESEIYW